MKTLRGYFIGFSIVVATLALPLSAFADQSTDALIAQLLAQIAALQAQINSLQGQNTTNQFCYNFNTNLRIGDSGGAVVALQTALQKQGMEIGGDIKGTFGEGTASAVVGFQEKYANEILTPNGLTHGTGFVGRATRAKLNKLYACASQTSQIPSDQNSIVSGSTLSSIPLPRVAFNGTEDYTTADGGEWTRYKLSVTNWNQYPNELFAVAPDLPLCGLNTNAPPTSRTWIYIYNSANPYGGTINSFCAVTNTQDLANLWFAVQKGGTPPSTVYLTLADRRTRTTYISNTVSILAATTTPSITVLSPNGGESYSGGSTQVVRWSGGDPNWTIGVMLQNSAGITARELAQGAPNNGSISWVVPSDIPAGLYRIRVSCGNCSGFVGVGPFDDSDNFFTINNTVSNPAAITITAPNGGETLAIYFPSYRVKWKISGDAALRNYAQFWLERDGVRLGQIFFNKVNDGIDPLMESTLWNGYYYDASGSLVQAPVGNGYKITAIMYGIVNNVSGVEMARDTSDASFSIVAPTSIQTTATLTVQKSGTGSGTVRGSDYRSYPQPINCGTDCSETYTFSSSTVTVRLSATPYQGSVLTNWNGCSSTGSDWSGGPIYCDAVLSASNANPTVTAMFNAVLPQIIAVKVLSPNGGEQWERGSVHNISWSGGDPTKGYGVELVSGDGTSIGALGDLGKTSAMSFDWKVGSYITQTSPSCTPTTCPDVPAGQYRLKIYPLPYNSAVFDLSDAPFSIVAPVVAPVLAPAPVLRAISQVTDSSTGNTWLSLSYTNPSGFTNNVLVVEVNMRARENVTQVVYFTKTGSQNLTRALSDDCGGTYDQKTEAWYLVNPPLGVSGTVQATYDGAVGSEGMFAMTYSGVDQTHPLGSIQIACGTSGSRITSLTTQGINSLVVGLVNGRGGTSNSPFVVYDGFVKEADVCSGTALSDDCYAVSDKTVNAAGTVQQVKFDGRASNNWAVSALELKAAPVQTAQSSTYLTASTLEAIRAALASIQAIIDNLSR